MIFLRVPFYVYGSVWLWFRLPRGKPEREKRPSFRAAFCRSLLGFSICLHLFTQGLGTPSFRSIKKIFMIRVKDRQTQKKIPSRTADQPRCRIKRGNEPL